MAKISPTTIKMLKKIKESLDINVHTDWSANDASEEFSTLADMMGPCIAEIEKQEEDQE